SIAQEAALVASVAAQLATAAGETAVPTANPEGDALVAACRGVGEALGIEVHPPRTGGDCDPGAPCDPLGDLARASGFHARPVTLPEGWWRRGGGEPLLGQLADDGRTPVALLPAQQGSRGRGSAYELRDAQGRCRPVDDRLAARIAPTAWMFYRPLPDEPLGLFDLIRFCSSLRDLGRELGLVLAMALLGALFGLAIPIASGILVDQVIPEANVPRLAVLCGFLGVLTLSAAVFQAIQGLMVLRIEGRVSATLIPA